MDFESEMIASFGPSIVECESESFSCDLDDIPDANGSNNASIKNFVPNDGDVLLGRGKSHNHHPGNILFKDLIKQSCERWGSNNPVPNHKTTVRINKKTVVWIVDSILEQGRFLKRQKEKNASSGPWIVISRDSAIRKVSHAIHYQHRQSMKRTIISKGTGFWSPKDTRACRQNDSSQFQTKRAIFEPTLSADVATQKYDSSESWSMTLKSLSRAAFLKETAADVMPASTLCLPRDPVLPGMVRRHTHDNGFAQAVPYQMPQDCDSEWAGDSFASRMITPTRVDHIHTAVPTNRRRTSLSSHCVGLGSPINDVQQPRRMSNPVVKMRDPIRLFTEPSFYSMPANGSSHESFFANINECNLISPFFEDQIEDDVGYLGVDDDNFGIDENSANASGTTWIPPSIADMSIDELSGADIW